MQKMCFKYKIEKKFLSPNKEKNVSRKKIVFNKIRKKSNRVISALVCLIKLKYFTDKCKCKIIYK